MNIVDIMFYLKKGAAPDVQSNIMNKLRNIEGVIAPRFVPNKDNMLIIAYNPAVVHSSVVRQTMDDMNVDACIAAI